MRSVVTLPFVIFIVFAVLLASGVRDALEGDLGGVAAFLVSLGVVAVLALLFGLIERRIARRSRRS